MIDAAHPRDSGTAPPASQQLDPLDATCTAAFRTAGRGERIRHSVRPCALGHLLVAATMRGVCRVELDDRPDVLEASVRSRFAAAEFVAPDATFTGWMDLVLAAAASPGTAHAVPLDLRGTAFQHVVWRALCAIPPGSTASYRGVAENIGRPGAARAVAGACAANPVALLVPCHRVVREDGGLGGFRWGLARKRQLLESERG
jgi:AraC family transcriptional regulator of adaptative response/methylated-DNA-[protein]-cysteine methyltransferase